MKQVKNLTTSLSDLCFSPKSEILLGASRWKRNSLKLINIPGLSVYKNWPNFRTVFKYPTCVNWSGDSQLLAVGNEEGNVNVF